MKRIGSLFSGIGGLEFGIERATGAHVVWQVELDPFCRCVLERHWPDAKRFDDVRTVGAHNLERVDIICGGFPCQDLSVAGRGIGLDGERSGLFFEAARIIREIRPTAQGIRADEGRAGPGHRRVEGGVAWFFSLTA